MTNNGTLPNTPGHFFTGFSTLDNGVLVSHARKLRRISQLPPTIAPATPPNPHANLSRRCFCVRSLRTEFTYPRIAYARPSLLGSVMVAMLPRPTPIAPANTPCRRRIVIASGKDVEVPNARQVNELPRRDTKSTARGPCFSAAVA